MVERFHGSRGKEEPHVLIEMKDEGDVGDRKEGVYCEVEGNDDQKVKD